jgi:hypothetical protein
VSTLFVVVIVVGGFVLCGLVIDVVVVAGSRFLGSGRVGGVGRSSDVAYCCGDVLTGKRVIVLFVSWHACCRPGIRMFCSRTWWRYACRLSLFATIMRSTGQSAGMRVERLRSLSSRLCDGMSLSWLTWRCTRVVRLGCWSMAWVLHGESSHAGSIGTTRNGLADDVAQASACKIVLRMSAGSYSGFARHEPVQR